jgi:phosphonate transport system ATP-binding protein
LVEEHVELTDNHLEISALRKEYKGGPVALESLDASVKRGEYLSIIGLSGAGKSTLLRCINRLIDPTSGAIIFNPAEGKPIAVHRLEGNALIAFRRRIGMIFQHFNLVPRLTVFKNVLAGRIGYKTTGQAISHSFTRDEQDYALRCLDRVGILDKAYVRADQLSGGQMQRVGIARALMQQPEMILADEPVASLDPATSRTILEHLRGICHEDGITVVCNLHDLGFAKEYSDRIVGLADGKLIYDGPPDGVDAETYEIVYGVKPVVL